jgi:hypothetical protein
MHKTRSYVPFARDRLWQRQESALHFAVMKPAISLAHSATFPDVFRTPENPHLCLSDRRTALICGAM